MFEFDVSYLFMYELEVNFASLPPVTTNSQIGRAPADVVSTPGVGRYLALFIHHNYDLYSTTCVSYVRFLCCC